MPSPAVVSPVAAPIVASAATLSNLNWSTLVETLGLTATNQQLAMNCSLRRVEGATLHLTLDEGQGFLLSKERERRLEQAVQAHLGEGVRVSITTISSGTATATTPSAPTPAQLRERRQQEREAAARVSIERDPQVRAFRETFNAEVDPKSICPLDV
ncbi:hypothetical protein CCP3SC15_590010 [Gammaproteobacteria bacterium]